MYSYAYIYTHMYIYIYTCMHICLYTIYTQVHEQNLFQSNLNCSTDVAATRRQVHHPTLILALQETEAGLKQPMAYGVGKPQRLARKNNGTILYYIIQYH